MYAVIFRATIAEPDDEYFQLAKRLRELAKDYGCLEFVFLTEGREEISISYWADQKQISAWKENQEHVLAQKKGREKWYETYRVQIAKIEREYQKT